MSFGKPEIRHVNRFLLCARLSHERGTVLRVRLRPDLVEAAHSPDSDSRNALLGLGAENHTSGENTQLRMRLAPERDWGQNKKAAISAALLFAVEISLRMAVFYDIAFQVIDHSSSDGLSAIREPGLAFGPESLD